MMEFPDSPISPQLSTDGNELIERWKEKMWMSSLPGSGLEPVIQTPNLRSVSNNIPGQSSACKTVTANMWMGHRRTRLVHSVDLSSLRLNSTKKITPNNNDTTNQNESISKTDKNDAVSKEIKSVPKNSNFPDSFATTVIVNNPNEKSPTYEEQLVSESPTRACVESVLKPPNKEKVTRISNNGVDQSICLPVFIVNGQKYNVLKEVGQGGSSKVFEVYNKNFDLLAIKCVYLRGADQTVRDGYLNEINLLKQLQQSRRVIKFYDHEYNADENKLFVVMERGDVDLATFIHKETEHDGITPEIVKCFWAEMLRAVRDIHLAGIIHSDLKPANFLLVAGKLKLIDFGIASSIPRDVTSVIKDTKCGTPSYMSPEALKDVQQDPENNSVKIKIGVKSDVWSLGCILYHMVYGRTPFQHLRNNLRLLAIVDPSFQVEFPPVNDSLVLDVLKKCLVREVKQRASVDDLLCHPYIPKGYSL